jgi:PDZ domain-containing secreted protein
MSTIDTVNTLNEMLEKEVNYAFVYTYRDFENIKSKTYYNLTPAKKMIAVKKERYDSNDNLMQVLFNKNKKQKDKLLFLRSDKSIHKCITFSKKNYLEKIDYYDVNSKLEKEQIFDVKSNKLVRTTSYH